ncbi:MAG TPA: hypothetical protein VGG88_12450 [Gaiellaceae bacterium]
MFAAPPSPPIVIVDRGGDSGSAPDITKITVTTKKSGVVNFIVVFKTPFGSHSSFYVYFGTNNFRLGPGGLEVWDPPADDFEPLGSESGTFSVAPGGRALQTSFNLADIGNPKSFHWTAESIDGDGGPGQTDTVAGSWPRK